MADTGKRLLLLLHGKHSGQNAYYQVFIEPKGKHLAGVQLFNSDDDSMKMKFEESFGIIS